jgi:phosphohistidine phosphatase SixA
MRRRRWLLALLALAALAAASRPAAGAEELRGAELLAALRGGGFILYFRHADTDHSQNDQRMGAFEDCARQRNLTDKGRDHARAIGAAIRTLAIPIGPVLASPYCRTVETATLAFGAAERLPEVRDPGAAPPGSPGRFAALRALLSAPPPAGTDTVIVGHAIPFQALVGGQYLDEGQAAVVRPEGGGFRIVTRVSLAEWRELATLPLTK